MHYAFEWAIRRAYDAAKYNVQAQLSTMIAELMPQQLLTRKRQAQPFSRAKQ